MRLRNPNEHTIEEVIECIQRIEAASDRAFRRWMDGEVKTRAAAVRLAREVEEARSDARFHPDFDWTKHEEWA